MSSTIRLVLVTSFYVVPWSHRLLKSETIQIHLIFIQDYILTFIGIKKNKILVSYFGNNLKIAN